MTDQDLQHDIDTALVDNPQVLWGSRVIKRSLFDADGSTLGSIQDLLLIPAATGNNLYLNLHYINLHHHARISHL